MYVTCYPSKSLERLFWLVETLESKQYTFAKAMPEQPHWYTLRRNWSSRPDFFEAVRLLRDFGEHDSWYHQSNVSFHANGWSYWTRGLPVEETILINRARLAPSYGQDYGRARPRDLSGEAIEEIFEIAEVKSDHNVLGAGIGGSALFVPRPGLCGSYIGLEPSARHFPSGPLTPEQFVRSSLPDFYRSGFDKILLFSGLERFLPMSDLAKLGHMLAPGGTVAMEGGDGRTASEPNVGDAEEEAVSTPNTDTEEQGNDAIPKTEARINRSASEATTEL